MHVVLCFKMRKANQNRSISVIGILKKVYLNNWTCLSVYRSISSLVEFI